MHKARTILTALTTAVVTITGCSIAGAAPANAAQTSSSGSASAAGTKLPHPHEAAGKYVLSCIEGNGTSYVWTDNDPKACGGWLDIYIGGEQIAHVNEAELNGVVDPSVECVWSASGAVFGLVAIAVAPESPLGWIVAVNDLALAGYTCAR
jgi:hypothetical protein